ARADAAAEDAQQQAARSRVLDLSSSSVVALDEDPELSILLALEAAGADVDGRPLSENVSALHESVLATRVLYGLPGSSQMATDASGTMVVGVAENGGPVSVRDLTTGEVLFELAGSLPAAASGAAVAMTRDGSRVAADVHLGVAVWDTATREVVFEEPYAHNGGVSDGSGVYRLAFSSDGTLLASRGWDHTIRVWDLTEGSLVVSLPSLPDDWAWGGGLAFNADSTLLAASFAAEARVWEVPSGELVQSLGDGWTGMSGVAFLPDGDLVVSYWAADPTIAVWDLDGGSERLVGRGEGLFPRAVAVNDAGDQIVTANDDGKFTVWGLTPNDLSVVRTTGGHTAAIGGLSIVDGDRIVTGSDDGTIRVWDNSTHGRGEGATALSDPWLFSDIAYGPDGRQIASGTVTDFWISDAETGELLVRVDLLAALPDDIEDTALSWMAIGRVEFTSDGSQIGVSVWDLGGTYGAVGLWHTTDGSLARSFLLDGEPAGSSDWLDLSPDGSLVVATVGYDIQMWETDTGEHVLTIPSRSDVWWKTVAFDPSGTRIAGQGKNQGWDTVPTLVEVMGLDGAQMWAGSEHLEFVSGGIEYSPDGDLLVTSGLDEAGAGVVVVWDAATGDAVTRLTGFAGEVVRAVFSPDGDSIATGEITTLRLWDTSDSTQIWALDGHPGGYVNSLAFSPDGTRLISAAEIDGLVRTWYLDFDDLVELAEGRLTRDFAESECALYEIDPCPAGS
ncbi:MAG: hypothetical protein ABFS21_11620, partial [Actinomycetota bacterium]